MVFDRTIETCLYIEQLGQRQIISKQSTEVYFWQENAEINFSSYYIGVWGSVGYIPTYFAESTTQHLTHSKTMRASS